MSRLVKNIAALVLFAASASSWAQSAQYDGAWLKRGLDAAERVSARQNATADDIPEAMLAVGFFNGVVAAHNRNVLLASLIASTMGTTRESEKRKSLSAVEEAKVKTALAFAPLINLPKDVTNAQAYAIVNKYLAANPEKWNQNADTLIVDALSGAFKRP